MTERDTVRRGYDELQEGYAAVRSGDGRDVAILEEFLTPLSRSARLLDAGCGPGSPVLREVSAKATAFGLDFSREQLRLASGNAPRASLVQGDMTALPLGNDIFDAVVAYHSLIHIPFEAHRTVIEEFSRILRPGGRLLISEDYTPGHEPLNIVIPWPGGNSRGNRKVGV